MKAWHLLLVIGSICLKSCASKNDVHKEVIKVDARLIDSIKNNSDTSYTKTYRSEEFATAEYFISQKTNTICQVMKDVNNNPRQIIITQKDIRKYFAEYYVNGQLKAKLFLDSSGKFNGPGKYYYENGIVKSEGNFNHGLFAGTWKNYDDKGKNISVDTYDHNGQLQAK